MILVETDISEEWDSSTDWSALARKAVESAVAASRERSLIESAVRVELSVKLTDDSEVRALNAGYRGKDKATNVLSFPMVEAGLLGSLATAEGGEMLLGDVVLAHGVCLREAEEKGVGFCAHAFHIIVHGTLHLLGYDHETGEAEAEEMEALERKALAAVGIADPYPVDAR
jgi:probable rRNA maturation factor